MKIGILTFHSSINEGAILQAYCLARNLQATLKTWDVEIIDHRYPSKVEVYRTDDGRSRALEQFIAESLPLSSQRFETDDRQPAFDYIRRHCDALVVGSDQVWKFSYSKRWLGLRREQLSPMHPAFPNVYWPDATIDMPKIAYAASIGHPNWSSIPKNHRSQMRQILAGFRLLGVRDQRTMSFLEWLDPAVAASAERVPDPTFSFDVLSSVDQDALREKLTQYGVDFSRPRAGIILRNTKLSQHITEWLKQKGYQTIGISEPNPSADVQLSEVDFTPFEWAAFFGLVDVCLSSRMHGCIYCILSGTPFVGVDFRFSPIDGESKIKDLMRSFDLAAFYFEPKTGTLDQLQAMCDRLTSGSAWPHNQVADRRTQFQHRSEAFSEKISRCVSTTS